MIWFKNSRSRSRSCLDLPLLGDVFERRHPSAVCHRLVDDTQCAAVGRFHDLRRCCAGPHAGEHAGKELLRIAGEISSQLSVLEEIEQ